MKNKNVPYGCKGFSDPSGETSHPRMKPDFLQQDVGPGRGHEVLPDSSLLGHFSKLIETTTLTIDSGDLGGSPSSATNSLVTLGKSFRLSAPLLSLLHSGGESNKIVQLS